MRLWTLHPRYLDARGLVAAWREALLAQKVLAGKTRGYRHHPQLLRFRAQQKPLPAIAAFLTALAREATRRGYHFDASKISRPRTRRQIPETRGQLQYEWQHLLTKLRTRDPRLYRQLRALPQPDPHPLFRLTPGPVQPWERPTPPKRRTNPKTNSKTSPKRQRRATPAYQPPILNSEFPFIPRLSLPEPPFKSY